MTDANYRSVTQEITELYVANDTAKITKLPANMHPTTRALRLYRAGPTWLCLQIRSPEMIRGGFKVGARSYLANLHLRIEEAEELHTRLGEFIDELKQ